MPVLNKLFFQNLIKEISPAERQALNNKLAEIYAAPPREYQNLEKDFAICKQQLLTLLEYIINLNTDTLQVFEKYASKVSQLTPTSAAPDLLITLGAAKTTLENALPAIITRHETVDKAALDNFTVTLCYNGAYANLEYALTENFFDRTSLSDLVHVAKRDLLMQFAKEFLRSKKLIEHPGNEIHMVNSLFNYIAVAYGLPLQVDKFASNIPLAILQQFQNYIRTMVNADTLVKKVSQLLPALPEANITEMSQFKMLEDFFQTLGEKNPGAEHYQFLYNLEELEDSYVVKKGIKEFQSCILASYLEKAGFISETELTIGNKRVMYSGEYLVAVNDGSYSLLSDTDLSELLPFVNTPSLFNSIIKQMSSEVLLIRFMEYQEIDMLSTNKRSYAFTELMRRPNLPLHLVEQLYSNLVNSQDNTKLRALASYVFINRHALSQDKLTHLASKFSDEEIKGLLRYALKNDYSDIAAFLLQFNANLMPLKDVVELAIKLNAIKTLEMLSQNNVDFNQISCSGLTVPLVAIKYNRPHLLVRLQEWGVNLNTSASVEGSTPEPYRGRSPVHVAAFTGDIQLLQLLHRLGADLTQRSFFSETAASVAVKNDKSAVLTELHSLGVDLNLAYEHPKSPLVHQAVSYGNMDVLKTLRYLGLSLDAYNDSGQTPAHIALVNKLPTILKTLHELGADINKANSKGITLASQAAMVVNIPVLKLLKELKVNLNAQDTDGATAIYHAAANRKVQSIRSLKRLKVNLDIPNKDGNTPVFIAAAEGYNKVLYWLAKYKANLNTVNNKGESPSYIAAVNNRVNCLDELIKHKADLSQIYQNADDLLTLIIEKNRSQLFLKLLEINVVFYSDTPTFRNALPKLLSKNTNEILYALIKSDNELMLHIVLHYLAEKKFTFPQNLILYAAQHAKSGAIFFMIHQYAPKFKTDTGDTPAHIAARFGNVAALRAILKLNKNINYLNALGESPAFIAAANGQLAMLELLKANQQSNQVTQISAGYLQSLVFGKSITIQNKAEQKFRERISMGDTEDRLNLLPRDIAEILEYTEIVSLLDNNQPRPKPLRVTFFVKKSAIYNKRADAMDVDAENIEPQKPDGKRGIKSLFSDSIAAKKPKNQEDAVEEHQYSANLPTGLVPH